MFDGTTLPQKISGKKADVFFFDDLGPVLDKPPKYFVEWDTVNIKPKEPDFCGCAKCVTAQVTNYAASIDNKSLTIEAFQRVREQMLRQFYERQPVRPEPVKVFKILEDPKHWTKNHLQARRGEYIMRCIMGALSYKWGTGQVGDANTYNDAGKIARVLNVKYGIRITSMDYPRIVANWNDAPGTTHKMVLEVLKEAGV